MTHCNILNIHEWVAVKKDPFVQKSPGEKLIFNVAWNEFENKIAVSCQEHHRVAKDIESHGWASLFSLPELAHIHQQLTLIYPHLKPHFPPLHQPARNLWGYVMPVSIKEEDCLALKNYLVVALDICGKALLLNVLFEPEDGSDERYLEDINELNRQSYEDAYDKSLEELEEVLELRKQAENMLHMATVYALEDEVMTNATIALAELYNYHLQPFLDLRELSYSKLQGARQLLKSEDVGQRIKEKTAQEFNDWQHHYINSIDSVRMLYIEYYTKTTKLVKGQRDRMIEDQQRFGRVTFEVLGSPRLNRLQIYYHEERLKLLRARRLQKEHERDKVEQQLVTVNINNLSNEMESIEAEVYAQQLQVFDLRLEILQEEEAVYKKKIALYNKTKNDACEDGLFFDAVESLEEIKDEMVNSFTDPKITNLKEKLAAVFCRRAAVRNKKKACIAAWEKKKQFQHAEISRTKKHHNLQTKKMERQKLEEQNKNRIEQERKMTVQRLRAYRSRYKSSDYQSEMNTSDTSSLLLESRSGNSTCSVPFTRYDSASESTVNSICCSEVLQQTITGLALNDKKDNSDVPSSCPVFPSDILSAPPPPPPPPPPPFLLTSQQVKTVPFGKDNEITLKQLSSHDHLAGRTKKHSSVIDLQELQAVRKCLRRIPGLNETAAQRTAISHEDKVSEMLQIRSRFEKNALSPNGESKDISDVLMETLQRIRQVTADSEESDDLSSDEGGFD